MYIYRPYLSESLDLSLTSLIVLKADLFTCDKTYKDSIYAIRWENAQKSTWYLKSASRTCYMKLCVHFLLHHFWYNMNSGPRGSMKGEILPFNTKYSNYLIVVTTITTRCTYLYTNASETCVLTKTLRFLSSF